MADLSGRVAIVTGGAQGIGAATVRRLAADGAHVVALDLDEAGATGQPEDIAAVIAFLASPESGFVTGQTIYATGSPAV